MRKVFIFLTLAALGGCGDAHLTNSQRCEHVHPDEMSPALRDLCVAHARSTTINVPGASSPNFGSVSYGGGQPIRPPAVSGGGGQSLGPDNARRCDTHPDMMDSALLELCVTSARGGQSLGPNNTRRCDTHPDMMSSALRNLCVASARGGQNLGPNNARRCDGNPSIMSSALRELCVASVSPRGR